MTAAPIGDSVPYGTLYRAYGLGGDGQPWHLYTGKTVNSLSSRFAGHRASEQDRYWWPGVHYDLTLIIPVPVHLLDECEDMETRTSRCRSATIGGA